MRREITTTLSVPGTLVGSFIGAAIVFSAMALLEYDWRSVGAAALAFFLGAASPLLGLLIKRPQKADRVAALRAEYAQLMDLQSQFRRAGDLDWFNARAGERLDALGRGWPDYDQSRSRHLS